MGTLRYAGRGNNNPEGYKDWTPIGDNSFCMGMVSCERQQAVCVEKYASRYTKSCAVIM
ncbi:MAG: hypothetical protein FWG92_01245 [Leptospirales bacterium]|nr:hypothetical protein [Leptospirales bacterium]